VSGAPCSLYSPRQLEERRLLGTAGTQEAPAEAGAVLQHHSPPRPASSWENAMQGKSSLLPTEAAATITVATDETA
jgi:hypothetical protein